MQPADVMSVRLLIAASLIHDAACDEASRMP
jgi:hypothetical protein